jgi:hypothetical protein
VPSISRVLQWRASLMRLRVNIPAIPDQLFDNSKMALAGRNAKCFGLMSRIRPFFKEEGGDVFMIAQ